MTKSIKRGLKKKIRTPGNKLVFHSKKKKPKAAKCAICGKPLHGVPRLNLSDMRKLAKSKRRPERFYGGNLCSECMRNLLRKEFIERFES